MLLGGDGNLYTSEMYGGNKKYEDATNKLGDADLDGDVNMADASLILDHCLEISFLKGDALQCADADDGAISMSDASVIFDNALELSDSLQGKTLADKEKYVE